MVKTGVRTLAMTAVIGLLATSTQTVRAAEHGEGTDIRQRQVRMMFSGSMVPTALEPIAEHFAAGEAPR